VKKRKRRKMNMLVHQVLLTLMFAMLLCCNDALGRPRIEDWTHESLHLDWTAVGQEYGVVVVQTPQYGWALVATRIFNVNRPGTLPSEELTVSHKRAVVINGDHIIDENARHVERLNPVAIAARAQVARFNSAEKAVAKAQEDVRIGQEMDARSEAKMKAQADKRQAKLDKLEENRKARAIKSASAEAERLLMFNMTAAERRVYRLQQAERNLASLVAAEVADEHEVSWELLSLPMFCLSPL
jgi:hypothetical protein